MRIWARYVVGGLLAVTTGIAADVRGETCKLELKRIAPRSQSSMGLPSPEDQYRETYAQSIFLQLGTDKSAVPRTRSKTSEFSRIIRKEPARYVSKQPARAVIKLGSHEYGLVFDELPPKPKAASDAKPDVEKGKAKDKEPPAPKKDEGLPGSQGYGRLYFDRNHNGDLTDDPVVDGDSEGSIAGPVLFFSPSYRSYTFPRIDLVVEVDGKAAEYSLLASAYSRSAKDYSFLSASFSAAAYREGRIRLNGKSRHVVLLDHNSNGRFDDGMVISEPLDRLAAYGLANDALLVDPAEAMKARRAYTYGLSETPNRHFVSKTIHLDGEFYHLKLTPAGDELTLTPSTLPVGKVTNPAEEFRAIVYGDLGMLAVNGGKGKPVSLPEGRWKLLSYTIRQSEPEKPQEPVKPQRTPEKKDGKLAEGLVSAIAGMFSSAAPMRPSTPSLPFSTVSAVVEGASQPIEVRGGKSVEMPFGPPFKPVVRVEEGRDAKHAYLSLSLVGKAGETCNSLNVRGRSPEKPKLTILDPKGATVAEGVFEYG